MGNKKIRDSLNNLCEIDRLPELSEFLKSVVC